MKAEWCKHRIAEIAEKITDGSHNPPKGVPQSEFLMLSSKNIFDDDLHYADPRHLTAEQFEQENKRTGILPRDVLLTIVGTIGRCAVVPNDAPNITLQRSVAVIRPRHSLVDSRFLMYSFIERSEELNDRARGVAQKGIYLETLRQLDVALPPLPEQHRIVAVLDEALNGIATAKANAEKNRQYARALFESYLQNVFTTRGEGWISTTLGKATGGVFTGPFGSLLHKGDYVSGGIPLVNPAHITNTGIEPDWNKTVSDETAQRLSNYRMEEGDIVIGRRGEMGRCALVTDVEDGWLCGTGSFVIKPAAQCDSHYLVRLLRSDSCRQALERIAGGAVMPNLSNTDLGNLPISLPPLERQKSIVGYIEGFAQETQRLEALYQQKLAALNDLKKSLLHQAFSGQL